MDHVLPWMIWHGIAQLEEEKLASHFLQFGICANKQSYFFDDIYSKWIERVSGNDKSAKCKLSKKLYSFQTLEEIKIKKKTADLKEIQTFFLPKDHQANQHQRHCQEYVP